MDANRPLRAIRRWPTPPLPQQPLVVDARARTADFWARFPQHAPPATEHVRGRKWASGRYRRPGSSSSRRWRRRYKGVVRRYADTPCRGRGQAATGRGSNPHATLRRNECSANATRSRRCATPTSRNCSDAGVTPGWLVSPSSWSRQLRLMNGPTNTSSTAAPASR